MYMCFLYTFNAHTGIFVVGPINNNGGKRTRRDTFSEEEEELRGKMGRMLLDGPSVQMFLDRRAVPAEARARLRELLGDSLHVPCA